jgi:F0F1-type ATP synthase membrane subunit c/vacuolar-type H+-ATPase subunit K
MFISNLKEKHPALYTAVRAVGAIITIGLAIIVGALVDGFTVSTLWNWFIVGLGVPAIGIARAVGIGLVFAAISFGNAREDFSKKSPGYVIWYNLGFCSLVLVLGYFIHRFV